MRRCDMQRLTMHKARGGVRRPRSGNIMALILAALLIALSLAPAALAQNPAPGEQTSEPAIGAALLPRDLTPLGMFLHADVVVKAVIIGLAFASLVTWTAFVAKSLELQSARRRARRGLRILAGTATLGQVTPQLGNGSDAAAQLVQAAVAEIRLSEN